MTILIDKLIKQLVAESVIAAQERGELPGFSIPQFQLQQTKLKAHGDYATNLCMVIAPLARMSPKEIASTVIKNLPQNDVISEACFADPGFINFFINWAWLVYQVGEILSEAEDWGKIDLGKGERILVEFVSANPTGPLTVGSARNAVIGDTLARLLESAGYSVSREYYINDMGSKVSKMGKTLYWHYCHSLGIDEPIPDEYYPGDFLKQLGKEFAEEFGSLFSQKQYDDAIKTLGKMGTERTLYEIKNSLEQIGIQFDSWFSECSLYDSGIFDLVYRKLDEKGLLYEKDNATWFKSSEFDLDQDAVVIRSPQIIANPNERPTYLASDIAYLWSKLVDRGFSKAIYIWGADHLTDKSRLLAATKALDLDPDRIIVILYQLVNLARGGNKFRMSKSSGELVTLREFVNEVGVNALRFFLNSVSHNKHLTFDLDLVSKQSSENPVYYIQYAYVRICSILRKAKLEGWDNRPEQPNFQLLNSPAELALIKKMLELPEVIEKCVTSYSSHYLSEYAFELASHFHAFYRDCPVIIQDPLGFELSVSRLNLVMAAKIVMTRTLHLLGVEAVEYM